jgi:endonuclease G
MRWWVVVLAVGLPASARAAPEVIGGSDAPPGAWPDAAAIYFRQPDSTDVPQCSGVLVAPTVVLTAGHCDPHVDASLGVLDNVLIGTSSLALPQDGETLAPTLVASYPDSQQSIDITVIVLARAAIEAPRAIATGWARLDIVNGAPIELVGYGAIDRDGTTYIDALQQAMTTITDFDCATSSGCNAAAQPAGELGAGGMGIDTCPGDSGGPLYLLAGYGTYLAGITSRSYDNASYACSEGGIYGRPDKIVAWIEQTAGTAVTHGPEPTAPAISAVHGDAGETTIVANDPEGSDHSYAIAQQPARGRAAAFGDGRVRVCVDPSAAPGSDAVIVAVTDAHDGTRTVDATIPIAIADGTAPASCDLMNGDGGGCCAIGPGARGGRGGAGSLALAFAVALALRRRSQ